MVDANMYTNEYSAEYDLSEFRHPSLRGNDSTVETDITSGDFGETEDTI